MAAARKVCVEVKVKLVIDIALEGVFIDKVIQEMDYDFSTRGTSVAGLAEIEDTEILDYQITDAK